MPLFPGRRGSVLNSKGSLALQALQLKHSSEEGFAERTIQTGVGE